ncbi:hypothetical protein LDO26_17305 [Luteimonas sp. BDR2-5]|uniref:hypothetical protein n=1 Tax=Proluteimonas luteida TaxID=2878685 RepID=UPI001E29AB89|nr:hypothetical protein [Luteimonas sp. BDR2-5]MCD9029951.1 hypothetical protein [Luteimonas sp. BDR2-5]
MKRALMKHAPVALLLACALTSPQASALDRLSGVYRPVGDAAAGMPVGGELRVTAEGRGWLARFRGEGLALLPVTGLELAGLFPGVAPEAGLQCAVSPAFLLCSVAPGTRFEDKDFTSTTGYFTAVSDSGIFEMQRVD